MLAAAGGGGGGGGNHTLLPASVLALAALAAELAVVLGLDPLEGRLEALLVRADHHQLGKVATLSGPCWLSGWAFVGGALC